MVPFEKTPSQKSVAEIFNEKVRAGSMRAFEDKDGGIHTWTPETDTANKHLLSILSDPTEYKEVTELIKNKSARIEELNGKMVLRRSERKQIEKVLKFE